MFVHILVDKGGREGVQKFTAHVASFPQKAIQQALVVAPQPVRFRRGATKASHIYTSGEHLSGIIVDLSPFLDTYIYLI